ncbi:helix-turn-helix domain-containing protein [Sulfurimonas sp. CS5]|uniref:helix-turn-helix domain-containing protein n=1 Tax=Sulfurimonas sp. CS5 TaxID=3391145 RepID=UPI0039EB1F84
MSNLDNLLKRHQKSLLTKKETASELNISQATLDRLRKSGEICSKKVGGGVFFTINELALFLDS